MTTIDAVARWRCAASGTTRGALIVLLHEHGCDENASFALAAALPSDATIAALRAPIAGATGFSWFAAWSPDQPVSASLANAIDYVERWLDEKAGDAEEIWLAGCGEGATLAAALALHAPQRYVGAALVGGTVPLLEAALPALTGRLRGLDLFFGHCGADRLTRSRAYLRDASGARVDERVYSHETALAAAALDDLITWFTARFTPPNPFRQENP
jgi:phospholipase/carboxylesterase